jgi:hypothetical protein
MSRDGGGGEDRFSFHRDRDSVPVLQEEISHMFDFFFGNSPNPALCLDKGLLDERRHCFRERSLTVVAWALRLFRVDGDDVASYDYRQGNQRLAKWMKQLWEGYDAYVHNTKDFKNDQQIEAMRFVRHLGYVRQVVAHLGQILEASHVLTRLLKNPEEGYVDTGRPVEKWMERNFRRLHGDDGDDDGLAKKANKSLTPKIVHKCLDKANELGLRWRNGYVLEERTLTFNGSVYSTRTYQYLCWDKEEGRRDGRESTVEEFVRRTCNKEEESDLWEALLSSRTRCDVVNALSASREREFPELRPRRNLFSFRNGVYNTCATRLGTFYTYDRAAHYLKDSDVACKFFDVTLELEMFVRSADHQGAWFEAIKTPLFQSVLDYQNFGCVTTAQSRRAIEERLGSDLAPLVDAASSTRSHILTFMQASENSCLLAAELERADEVHQALQTVLENCDELRSNLAGVLAALEPLRAAAERDAGVRQPLPAPLDVAGPAAAAAAAATTEPQRTATSRLPAEVQRWLYVLLGRLLHDLKRWDNWQIVPFIKGVAGTGKSLIAQVAYHFFDQQDVGTLMSNIEPQFGLSALADKFLYVCLEVKKNFGLDQSIFQSMVSGEQVSVSVKNKMAYSKEWTAPGILCGNEWASYKDSQGSIARRLAIFNFPFPVSKRDSKPNLLNDILEQELAPLVLKCNVAYREMADIHRDAAIWRILPHYFQSQQKALQVDSDPLMALLADETIFVQDASAWVAYSKFQKEYNAKCRELRGVDYNEPLIDDKLRPALSEVRAQKVCDVRADFSLGGEPSKEHWILGLRYVKEGGSQAAAAGPRAA